MATTADFRNGMCLDIDGQYYFIVEFLHVKPGKGPAFVRSKLKNVATGRVLDKTWNSGVKVEEVRIERRPYQYLYKDEMGLNFMHPETFEQISIPEAVIDGVQFLKEGDIVEAMVHAAPATVETGAEVRVPLFINEGELITIDTRDGSYVGRVKGA